MPRTVWLALSYNVPINPSKARVYVWRKLKEIGAEYFKQGVALLPNTAAEAKEIETGINEIIDGVKGVAADLGKQLRRMMDVV